MGSEKLVIFLRRTFVCGMERRKKANLDAESARILRSIL